MDIHERLSTFDSWLTGRIGEAHGARKDLAFRDLPSEESPRSPPWEYSLLEPGARSPIGEGWSVYRLNGVAPEPVPEHPSDAWASGPSSRSLLDRIAHALLGRASRR